MNPGQACPPMYPLGLFEHVDDGAVCQAPRCSNTVTVRLAVLYRSHGYVFELCASCGAKADNEGPRQIEVEPPTANYAYVRGDGCKRKPPAVLV